MSRVRQILIAGLFTVASSCIFFVGYQWINDYLHSPEITRTWADQLKMLISLASFVLLTLYILRLALAQVIRWALRHQQRKLLRVMQKIAPGLSKKIVGSLLGTSIALSGAVAAQASDVAIVQSQGAGHESKDQQLASFPQTQQATAPTPHWFPEQMSVPMTGLIASGAEKKPSSSGPLTEAIISQGQNLWSVAAERLGPQATTEEIATYWPKIYKLNRKVIGPDPNVLQIGTVLELPAID